MATPETMKHPAAQSIELRDQYCVSTDTNPIKALVHADAEMGNIRVFAEGYGEANSGAGEGMPILIEKCDGALRVVIWGDINQQDPTHIINLEGARESERHSEIEEPKISPFNNVKSPL